MPSNYLSCPLLLSEARLMNPSHIPELLKYFVKEGYAASTIRQYLGAILHFEFWRRHLCSASTLDLQSGITTFFNQHLCQCNCPPSFSRNRKNAQAALAHWLSIRDPHWKNGLHQTAQAQLLASYDQYLMAVVGLAPSTRCYRRRYAGEFLDWLSAQGIVLSQLSSLQLGNYIAAQQHVNAAADNTNQRTTSLKSFINFLVSEGESSITWISSISRPHVPHNIVATHPLTDDELNRLLKAFDRTQSGGKRDYAMARCLIDLGVRTSDVAGFSLDRIDWRRGYITLEAGKSRRERTLPMPITTIDGLTDYLHGARPITQDRHVFVHHRAPLGKGVQASTVRGALRRAYARAGFMVSESQVHRLRHTMATRLLHNQHSLKTIADILGHLSINTTTRYTHVDQDSLAAVVMPWPRRNK
jgi:integrase/recombinase XerD